MSGEVFVEVRCEEIPARMVSAAAAELGGRLFEELLNRKLTPRAVQTGFTPRRLAVALTEVPEGEPDRVEEVTGPPASVAFDSGGKPTSAAAGFAKRCGIDVSNLKRMETAKGEYVGATVKTPGRPVTEVVAELVPRVVTDLTWAKTMRWGTGAGPWARPIHGFVVLYEGEAVECEVFGIRSGTTTIGHPVLSPDAFSVSGRAPRWQDYLADLGERGIVPVFAERQERLARGFAEAADELGGNLVGDSDLLDRLTAMCGVPGVVAGSFDERFLKLPREVLVASLRDHQSAFTVERDGELLPGFLTLMDRPDDPGGLVRKGNEWVVAARLEDAAFFYAEDRKVKLADRAAELERLNFHAKLGSYADKSRRVGELCAKLGESLGWKRDTNTARKVAGIFKADLVTEMVGEFSSLQGIMGGVYAREEGYSKSVWRAVYDQYLPQGTKDPVPGTKAGKLVALADRLDTVVGILGIGLTPSGSKDPFGLRRAAQGIVRIALEGGLELDLDLAAARAYKLYEGRLEENAEDVLAVWRPFLFDRIRHVLDLSGFAYDEIEAALEVGAANLPDLEARVKALHEVRDEKGFGEVVLAAKRIANILREAPEETLNPELLNEPAEKLLFQAYQSLRGEIREAEEKKRYEDCLRTMTSFADVLDRFFVEVLVMDENADVRANRIGLLQAIQRTLSRTAGLTAMVVER